MLYDEPIFSVAPMMDWTDRHCRYFHRVMTRQALLYTEMVVADAIIHGDRDYLLAGGSELSDVALQLGGSDPVKLAEAARIGQEYGYDEINLNVGCPSDRVQSGTFGACLMREPELVGRCVAAMKEVVDIPVTVKCRIGVDEQDPGPALAQLALETWGAGCDALWVHARKAWLEGLSPKQNRTIPPLDYERVYRLKRENSEHVIGINGGIEELDQCKTHLDQVDGVMLGRAAYQRPGLLRFVDQKLFGAVEPAISYAELCHRMCDYAERHLQEGGKLHQITRHMIGLFHGFPGSRTYRQILSTEAPRADASPAILEKAFQSVDSAAFEHAA